MHPQIFFEKKTGPILELYVINGRQKYVGLVIVGISE
jgi:hypothetical protein